MILVESRCCSDCLLKRHRGITTVGFAFLSYGMTSRPACGNIMHDMEEELEELFGEIGGEFTVPELSPETKAMMTEAGLVDTMNAARPAQRMAEVGPWNSGAF